MRNAQGMRRRRAATAFLAAAVLAGAAKAGASRPEEDRAAPPAQADLRAFVVTPPAKLVELDVQKLEGEPSRLSWSEDGRLICVRTTLVDLWGNERNRHHLIDVASGVLRRVEQEPPWSGIYWAHKSALDAPGFRGFRVDLETREERVMATGVQGSLAPATNPTHGSELGPQGAAIASSVIQAQKVVRSTFKLHGEAIGEFVNTPPRFGLTYGWGPAGSGLIAFVDGKRRLTLMDGAGRRRQVPGLRDACLPAWSPDGSRLAVLERTAKKKVYSLQVVSITARER